MEPWCPGDSWTSACWWEVVNSFLVLLCLCKWVLIYPFVFAVNFFLPISRGKSCLCEHAVSETPLSSVSWLKFCQQCRPKKIQPPPLRERELWKFSTCAPPDSQLDPQRDRQGAQDLCTELEVAEEHRWLGGGKVLSSMCGEQRSIKKIHRKAGSINYLAHGAICLLAYSFYSIFKENKNCVLSFGLHISGHIQELDTFLYVSCPCFSATLNGFTMNP